MIKMCEHKKGSGMQGPKNFLIPDFKPRTKRINHYLLSFAFLLLTFTVCCLLYTAYAEAAVEIGKVTQIEGRVDILREGKLPAALARLGDSVFVKDVIRTKSSSKAEITFNDATILKVAQRSRIDISEYLIDGGGVSKAVIDMSRGKVKADVSKTIVAQITKSPKANKFEIRTPNAVAGVRGTDFFVFHSANSTGVLVTEGKVETYNPKFPDVKVEVIAGQITNVTDNKPPTRPKAATDIETKGHEKDVTPEKPKKKAEQPASESDSASESQQIFGYSSPDESTSTDSALPEGGLFLPTITPPFTEIFPDSLSVKDTTAPIVTITPSAFPEAGNFTVGSFSISSNEAATYSYSLDGGVWTTSTGGTSLTISGLTEGPHTLDIKATDSAGNVSSNTVSFSPSRYKLSGVFWGCIGNVTGSVSGEVAGISGQNWGGWNMTMSGTGNSTPNASWTLYAGGTSSDATYTDGRNDGYWIEIAPGTSDYSHKTLTGDPSDPLDPPTFRYLSYDRMGTGIGTLTGTFDGLGNYALTDTGAGTYTETPLAWIGEINNYDDYYYGSLITIGLSGISERGEDYYALLGGTSSPWAGTTSLRLLGPYTGHGANMYPYIWTPTIYSGNYSNNYLSNGGTFFGIIGGVWQKNRKIAGHVYSLYIDPSGKAGILKGSLTGKYSPELSKYYADGTWTPIQLATLTPPSTGIGDLTYSADLDWQCVYTSECTANNSFISGSGTITSRESVWRQFSISGEKWGIWQYVIGGDYSETTSDTWESTYINYGVNHITGIRIDGQWSNEVLAGKAYGYYADITGTPATGIMIGETRGTFNPTDSTWQAVQTGAWLETNKFLEMAGCSGGVCSPTAENKAKLDALNIPAVEVGRANLSGTGTMGGAPINVNMNDVIFFAPNNGQAPGIWATGNVNGNYSCSACGATTVGLTSTSGGALTANFNVQTFDTSGQKWIATVNGSGTLNGGSYNGSTTFNGAAAGTNTGIGPGTFSGTAAGTAK